MTRDEARKIIMAMAPRVVDCPPADDGPLVMLLVAGGSPGGELAHGVTVLIPDVSTATRASIEERMNTSLRLLGGVLADPNAPAQDHPPR